MRPERKQDEKVYSDIERSYGGRQLFEKRRVVGGNETVTRPPTRLERLRHSLPFPFHLQETTVWENAEDSPRYFLKRNPFGGGAIGQIYEAWDIKLKKPVAVKLIPLEVAKATKTLPRFEAIVQNRNTYGELTDRLVEVYDYTFDTDNAYIVMEYLDPQEWDTLSRLEYTALSTQEGRPLDMNDRFQVAIQLAKIIDILAKRHEFHFDLKPDNVFVRREINSRKINVKLGDFGINNIALSNKLSKEDLPVTARYSSPWRLKENLQGKRGKEAELQKHRSEIFSFALLVWELIFGEYMSIFDVASNEDVAIAINIGKHTYIDEEKKKSLLKSLTTGSWEYAPEEAVKIVQVFEKALEARKEFSQKTFKTAEEFIMALGTVLPELQKQKKPWESIES